MFSKIKACYRGLGPFFVLWFTQSLSALGSAMFAGLAAGAFSGMDEAMDRMEDLSDTVYTPNPENTAVYDRLYGRYRRIIDFFRQEYEN